MLEVRDLEIRYGSVVAVDGISLDVKEGEIVCLIGPNGVGKTTTLLSIAGLVRPASGKIKFWSTCGPRGSSDWASVWSLRAAGSSER